MEVSHGWQRRCTAAGISQQFVRERRRATWQSMMNGLEPAKASDLPEPAPPSTYVGAEPQTISSAELLRGRKVVCIVHNGTVYRLQTTRMGRLILTK